MGVEYHGTIHFPNCVSDEWWLAIVEQFGLRITRSTEMLNPFTGDRVTVQDPPNLLASYDSASEVEHGVLRCNRLFLNNGVDETAEISFEGSGPRFKQIVTDLATDLKAHLTIDSWP